MKLVSLAHSIIINGLPEAEALFKFTRRAFPEPEWNFFYLNEFRIIPFSFYENLVEFSDLLLITEYQGYIGFGQYCLLKHALKMNKQVQVIKKRYRAFTLTEVKAFKLLCNDHQIQYAKVTTE